MELPRAAIGRLGERLIHSNKWQLPALHIANPELPSTLIRARSFGRARAEGAGA